jgi:hypothetical protein
MQTQELEHRTSPGRLTQTALLSLLFMNRPRQWIAMPEIARHLGTYAVHSRIADFRRITRTKGGNVYNRQQADLVTGHRLSWYWFSPDGQPPIA